MTNHDHDDDDEEEEDYEDNNEAGENHNNNITQQQNYKTKSSSSRARATAAAATMNPIFGKRGYKMPGQLYDFQSFSNHYWRTIFPQTKLIVAIRHPILWFQSFYNFRLRGKKISYNTSLQVFLDHPTDCTTYAGVCLERANFHVYLAILMNGGGNDRYRNYYNNVIVTGENDNIAKQRKDQKIYLKKQINNSNNHERSLVSFTSSHHQHKNNNNENNNNHNSTNLINNNNNNNNNNITNVINGRTNETNDSLHHYQQQQQRRRNKYKSSVSNNNINNKNNKNQRSDYELSLLQAHSHVDVTNLQTYSQEKSPLPNPVFVVDVEQLNAKKNYNAFVRTAYDISSFLHLQQPVSISNNNDGPPVHTKIPKGVQLLNICDDNDPIILELRTKLLNIGRVASEWILNYLVINDDNDDDDDDKKEEEKYQQPQQHLPTITVSSPKFFRDLVKSWASDPCL